jgi:hypothetical protein
MAFPPQAAKGALASEPVRVVLFHDKIAGMILTQEKYLSQYKYLARQKPGERN